MADDKKKALSAPPPDQMETLIVILFIFLIGGVIFQRINSYLNSNPEVKGTPQNIYQAFISSSPFLIGVSVAVSGILLLGIIALSRKIGKIRTKQRLALYPSGSIDADTEAPQKMVNKKWEKVLMHANSNNPSDWRLAIIEADIMLDELLDVQNYHGDTIGDKLKSIEKSDFLTLDEAWEAHKVRNAVAHEGSDFILTDRETRRVIGLYKKVFEEFKFI